MLIRQNQLTMMAQIGAHPVFAVETFFKTGKSFVATQRAFRAHFRFRNDTSRGSNPAGLCWSSTHLVQCGPDEPSRTWTLIRVQARMPEYSLNWTTGSSAIQG